MDHDDLARELVNPTPGDILAAYVFEEDVVELGWEHYIQGNHLAIMPYAEPILEQINPSDLQLTIATVDGTGGAVEVAVVERRSRSFSMNFMAYDAQKQCWAFKGEMRLLKHFLGIMSAYFRLGRVDKALVRSRNLFQPLCGLNDGLTRGEYEDKIKIGDCVLFLADRESKCLL
ncbi:hypothetical protein HRG_009405 [Hirsutella rhossiliensis]|uniref:Uncharacterized protein n=1 Tax=Hirsutella rhossiliensis TaxID=111463 RepID=A0A9P8MNV4_9HYPO|nr:uncharacterized protein HRG_09405 [Hirsutella rhossiliensis]KAH0959623.1 hypothetical protein HRG_09405 [Hirsutella rhossiliensis]